MIPRIIHQLWIGDQSKRPVRLMETWKALNPSCEYMLWTEDTLKGMHFFNRRFINKMPELNGKCNIMRYELLYRFGGFFIDADAECVNTLDDFFFENDRFSCWENEKQGFSPDGGIKLVSSGFHACRKNDELAALAIIELSQVQVLGRKSWQVCGNKFFAELIEKYGSVFPMKIYPSWYFLPQHGTGETYKGTDKIYAKHYWGGTFNLYGDKLNDKNLCDRESKKRERQNRQFLRGVFKG